MPKMRSGSAWYSAGVSRPSSTPMNPNDRQGRKRKRHRIAEQQETPRAWRTSAAPCWRPGKRSFRRLVVDAHQLKRRLLVLLHRVGDESAQVREALDQARDACRVSRKNPAGTSSLAGQRIRPPALPEISPLVQAFMKIATTTTSCRRDRQQKKQRAEDVDPDLLAARRLAATTSMRMCSL